jgi:Cu2+-exporting ATPase
MVGIGKAAEMGILIKDAESLETAKKIDTVVLDKTGTLTEGKPVLTDIRWLADDDNKKAVLYSLEKQSEHPLAGAVVNFYKGLHEIPLPRFTSISGMGAKAQLGDSVYLIGNSKLMTDYNIHCDSSLLLQADEWCRQAKTVVWFAENGNALAVMAFADTLKSGSADAVKQLKEMGIRVYMLTGDQTAAAEYIAQQTNIDDFRAEVLPLQKAEFILQLQNEGKIVAMVGDGINDSTALAQADISIAMGKGSDIAMDIAKITIISSDLRKIPFALMVSGQTVNTIRQNLFWAFIYNIVGIPIAAGVLYPFTGFMLNPMIAGAAMALSSVSVVSNSLRLKLKK